MNPAMRIAQKLAEGVEFFEKLPDEFQDDAMAEKVAACLETWKREAQQAIPVATRASRSKQGPATTNVRNDHDKE